jgi:GR25 family glycosyltransferase involved in LPS biosynthesis
MIRDSTQRAIILEDDITLIPTFFILLQYFEKLSINKYIIKLERFHLGEDENNEKHGHFIPWHKIKQT